MARRRRRTAAMTMPIMAPMEREELEVDGERGVPSGLVVLEDAGGT